MNNLGIELILHPINVWLQESIYVQPFTNPPTSPDFIKYWKIQPVQSFQGHIFKRDIIDNEINHFINFGLKVFSKYLILWSEEPAWKLFVDSPD